MTIETWLAAAVADAERRGLPELKPLLESLAEATRTLRRARFSGTAAGESEQIEALDTARLDR